ncbi:MAG TPA: hypothetical protein VIF40_20205 [Methylosinus sp.]|jgi:ElaB/YqjD/DUF883 family membrane-anchored ribosome-binding protein|uniref:hypothetical protein n=1 Tax=Methylosinus sp. TaxID=427 RepID=UPI002BC8F609|nr:hypothetical protein [Methyloceanibacter sp.]HMK39929.1 hypothetical protein [Methyloceanibacter sp.]
MPTPTPEAQELANQIDAIRADLQNLSSTVGRIANKQINRAQDKAVDAANEAEAAIRRNPLSAVAIAVGLGFLFGVFTRR